MMIGLASLVWQAVSLKHGQIYAKFGCQFSYTRIIDCMTCWFFC